ncbi:MAG: DUF6436 domain-containing protein [Pseudomonadota bacterium]
MDMPAPPPDSRSPTPPGARRWLYVIALIWLLLVAGLLWYSLRMPQQWFDPLQIQPHAFQDASALHRLTAALAKQHPDLKPGQPLFIRFRQTDCRCEQLVDAYHQLQTKLLQQQGYRVLTVEKADLEQLARTQLPELFSWITATPAVMVVDGNGALAYFGPYHQEGVCNSENSYLEPVLQAVNTQQPVNIINTLVFGCFCATAPSRGTN